MKRIEAFEPIFFLFFGLFHLHRVWALIDKASYAQFWLGVLEQKGPLYFALMGVLAFLCILGIVAFFRHLQDNYWWRWLYLLGGGYVLFDVFAIAVGLPFWHRLLLWMFDVNAPYWNLLWSGFIILGAFAFGLGLKLLHQRTAYRQQRKEIP